MFGSILGGEGSEIHPKANFCSHPKWGRFGGEKHFFSKYGFS